jgi:hypothetical protein
MKQELIQTELFERKVNDNGYVKMYVSSKWVYEHHYIIERFLNRELTNEEVVHHGNSIKSDNRFSNLYLFTNQKEHQRFHLKLKQHGLTRPLIRQLIKLKKEMVDERNKNIGVNI